MISEPTYQAWLHNPRAERVVLHEFADVKLANRPHVAFIGNVPHSFMSITATPLEFDFSLSDGLNVGDLEILNSGKLDDLLDESWRGVEFVTRWGAPDWDYTDFRVVARLTINDIVPINKQRLRIRFFDQRKKLSKPVLSQRGGVNNELLPLILGGSNLSPVILTNAATMDYRASLLPLESLVILDSGVATTVTADLAAGTFQLSVPAAGELRANTTAAHKTPLAIAQYLAGLAGINTVTTANFGALQNTMQLHCLVNSDATIDAVLTEILQPLGIYHRVTLAGDLELMLLDHAGSAQHIIRPSMIESGSLQPTDPIQPASTVRVHWQRNYSPFSESGIASRFDPATATAADLETRERLLAEYQLIERSTGFNSTDYEAEDFYTTLAVESEAIAEANRRLSVRSVKRVPWTLSVFPAGMSIREGDRVQIIHPRFGLAGGRTGTVTRAKLRLGNVNRIELEVLI